MRRNRKPRLTEGTTMSPTRRELVTMTSATIVTAAAHVNAGRAETAGPKFKAVGFDAFTIFDPNSVTTAVEASFPGKGKDLSDLWRTRQFEYCWLRTLNRAYVDFWQITEEALVFAFKTARIDLTPQRRAKLMDAYLQLKPFPDSVAALKAMRDADIRLAYVSNFTPTMLKSNSENVGIADLFEYALSTDAVKAFKPDPRAYQMVEGAFKMQRGSIAFAAFGGWDAAGARSFGLHTFWVNRFNAPREELGVKPDAEGGTLTELAKYVIA
jgi:2-haloacid dehalogenase